jgi:prophage maintenance system killer protein
VSTEKTERFNGHSDQAKLEGKIAMLGKKSSDSVTNDVATSTACTFFAYLTKHQFPDPDSEHLSMLPPHH